MFSRTVSILLLISTIFLIISCAESDDPSLDPDAETYLTFDVTGDETGSFSSDASFSASGSGGAGFKVIISRGSNVGSDFDFSIFFQRKYSERPPLPTPIGSYDLISSANQEVDDGTFSVIFTNFVTGTDFGEEVNGTLNVTTSNSDYIEGDFTFTATTFTGEKKEVEISGTFLAATTFN